MVRFRSKATVVLLTCVLAIPFEAMLSPAYAYIFLPQLADPGGVPQVVTPLSLYATMNAKSIATARQSGLEKLENTFTRNFSTGQFKLYTTADIPVGGIGFWLNPSHYGQDDRYLGVCARMVIPESPFRDDVTGHIAAVMDIYGKPIMNELLKEMEHVNDPLVKGVALVFVYGKDQLTSPAFDTSAEAFVLYISKADLELFCGFRLTLQALFNKSEIFTFQGASEMQTLTTFFLQA